MKVIVSIFIFICFVVLPGRVNAQVDFPLQISVSIAPPYPNRLSDFTDIESTLFVNVFNASGETHSIVLNGVLENELKTVRIATDPADPPTSAIEIMPGNNTLMLRDLEELFDPDHLNFNGASDDRIMSDGELPEGEYNFCLRAFDASNPGRALSPNPDLSPSACASFPVSLVDPPRINETLCDAYIRLTDPTIPIAWTWMRPAIGSENVSFTLRIVEVDPPDRVINDAWLSATTPELYFEDGIVETYKNLSVPDDVTLENGRSYVVQVIAEDMTGEIRFKNGGRSEPCVFHFREYVLSIGQPTWITENETTFGSGSGVELDYRIPLVESTRVSIDRDIYVFEIPEGMSPQAALERETYVHHNNMMRVEVESGETFSYIIPDFDLTFGKTYGARITIEDTYRRDDYFLENGGKSEILVFHYGRQDLIPKPEWITEQGTSFESPTNISLIYRIQMEEHVEMELDAEAFFFEIPEGDTPEEAAVNERNRHRIHIGSRQVYDDSPTEREFYPNPENIDPGKTYGVYIQLSDPSRMIDGVYAFENNGRSDILVFSVGGSGATDIVLTYPAEGDRLPFSFFPLIARYEPFNTAYQHWKSECTLLKDGSSYDFFTGDGLRWPGGSQAAQATLAGLSDISESESQNVAIFKSNRQHPAPFERGANYRWDANVKLYYNVEGTGDHLEFDKSSTFSRGMGPSDLQSPDWGAIIAPRSAINFSWITADEPEQLLPGHDINHATRHRIDYFNGTVDEKWVLEVDRSERFDNIIFHQEGRIGSGDIDYLSGSFTEEEIVAALYKEIESTDSFTPEENGYYYWRVKWLEDPDADWTSAHYESSQIRPFWVGDSPPPELTSRAEPPEACVSECLAPEITNETALSELTPGSTVSVGYFQMQVTEVTASSGNRYSGAGEIRVPFLNNIRVSVSFERIRINNGMQMYEGEVTAINDVPSISFETDAVTIGGERVEIPSMSETESEILNTTITSAERLVSLMTDERAIGMPIGLDNEIDGNSFVIGITGMLFKPREAELTAAMRVDIPTLGNHIPALGANGVCFTPNGLGDEGRLYLHRDWTITPDDSDVQFSFSGVESGDTTRTTYVEWDCQGYKCMAIRGEVEFSTELMVKEDPDGNILEGERVVADFGVKTCRGGNWIADIGIEPFQVNGMKGWGISSVRAYLDFSDIENPPTLTFPENYDRSHLGIRSSTSEGDVGRLENTWKGFYLAEAMAHAPSDFEHDVLGRPSFGIQNLIIDIGNGGGITGAIVGMDILDIEDGSVDNLSFSLDSVYISIVQSSIFEGGLRGKIGLPIFEVDDYLNYQGLVAYEPATGVRFNFNVNVSDTLNIPMWDVAEMHFTPESVIGIERTTGSEGEKTYVYTDLSGGINLTGDLGGGGGSSVPGVDFRGIRFEHIVYNSDGSQFDIGDFSFTSEQKSTAGFPVNINDIGIDLSLPRVGIVFDLALSLSDAGFSAEAGFGVYGALDVTGERELFRFDGVDLRSIEISQTCSGITIEGRLDFYDGDATYGDGVRGYISAVLPMDIAGSLTVQFGTKKNPAVENPIFGTRDNFSYWYVDGLIRIPGGVTIFSGFAIYGFGGGVYSRMRPDYSALTSTASMFGDAGAEPSSGVRYIPDWETLGGFKIMAILGTQPSEEAFNMDVTIEMNFTSSGGVGLFSIDGEGYVMASFEDRPEAKIWATIHFAYVNPGDGSERVEGDFALYVNFEDIIHGAGAGNEFVHAEFLVQDEIWYYYMGRQQMDQRGGLVVDLGDALQIQLTTYLMIGHGIPRRLPPLPEFIANLVYGPGRGELNRGAVGASTVDSREFSAHDERRMNDAEGFAFGTYFYLSTRFEFAIFYAELEAHFGFDILVNKDEDRVCFETGVAPGINDWYAMGQVYLGLRGEFGVFVDLFFIKGEFPIIELAAAISMEGGFPNPTWATGRAGLYYRILNGLVEGQCNFEVQIGEECSVVDENPLANMEFIGDIEPTDGSTEQNVFSVPVVSFNLPVNQLLELPAGLDDDPDAVRVFRPFIDRFELIHVAGGNALVANDFEFNETNTMASLILTGVEVLEGESRFRVDVSVKAFEHFPDGSQRIVQDGGRDWSDSKSVTFTTGPRPAVLTDENVMYSYPLKNQAYFLQGELIGSNGIIKLGRPQQYLFERTIDGADFDYVARVKPISGGDPIEYPVTSSTNGVTYSLSSLENEEYFVVQIVRKPARTLTESATASIERAASQRVTLSPVHTTHNFSQSAGSVTVNLQTTELPGQFVRSGETLLYHYYFRTSKFNTLSQKLAGVDLDAEKNMLGMFILRGQAEEPFEKYDLIGYFKGGRKILEPLVLIHDPFVFNYHVDLALPKVYTLYQDITTLKNSDAILRPMSFYYRGNQEVGFPPKRSVSISSQVRIEDPLQDWELEREAGITQPSPAATSTGTSSASVIGAPSVSSTTSGSTGAGMGVSGLLSGTVQNVTAPVGHVGSGSSSRRFDLILSTNIYVKLDAAAIKRQLSAIMSYRSSTGAYTYQNRLLRQYPSMYGKIFNALTASPDVFDFPRGSYGISFELMAPAINGGGSTLYPNQRKKSEILKRFQY